MKNKAYLSCEYLTHTQKKNDENEIPIISIKNACSRNYCNPNGYNLENASLKISKQKLIT